MEEKDLPQGSAASDNPMNLGWDLSQPLLAPPAQPGLSENEEVPPDFNSAAPPDDEAERPTGVAPVDAGIGDHTETPATASSPGKVILN